MGEIINLRRLRKIKARTGAEAEASANRAAHGRSKADKKLAKAERDGATRKLDGHRQNGRTNDEREHIGRQQQGSSRDDE